MFRRITFFSLAARTSGYITKVLITRRDLIGKAWFSRVAPLEDFTVAEGRLDYTDLGQKYGVLPASVYNYSWFSFGDESGNKRVVAADGLTKAVPPSLALSERAASWDAR
jgi:hypothetical protein